MSKVSDKVSCCRPRRPAVRKNSDRQRETVWRLWDSLQDISDPCKPENTVCMGRDEQPCAPEIILSFATPVSKKPTCYNLCSKWFAAPNLFSREKHCCIPIHPGCRKYILHEASTIHAWQFASRYRYGKESHHIKLNGFMTSTNENTQNLFQL